MRWIALSVALFALCPAPAAATDYVVLVQDQPAGHLKTSAGAGGLVEVDFSWRDNGRGPDVKESFTVDARGLPRTYELVGKNTFGAAMKESFRIEGGRAKWESRADSGDEAVGEDFVFMPLDGSFAYFDAVVRFLLARPDAAAPTIGGLTLRVERALRVTLPAART